MFTVLKCNSRNFNVIEDIGMVLKDTSISLCRKTFNDKAETILHYSRLKQIRI